MKKIIIAIDGFSSCGKSTMAKALARRIGYIYVDTGAMYRAVTLYAMRQKLIKADGTVDEPNLVEQLPQIKITFKLNAATKAPDTYLNGECVERLIRTLDVSKHVSAVAAIPAVRHAMVEQQQAMGKDKGLVMDGRDIGTTAFPNAELKIFVTASADTRAQRRYDELKAKGMSANLEEIKQNVEQRDYIDTHREVSPLKQAPDAVVLDNSNLTIPQQDEWLLAQYERVANS